LFTCLCRCFIHYFPCFNLHEAAFYKHSYCVWTQPNKSVLASQCAVFRSGDKAVSQFEKTSWLRGVLSVLNKSDRGWIILTDLMNCVISSSGHKRKIKAENFSWNFVKAARYSGDVNCPVLHVCIAKL